MTESAHRFEPIMTEGFAALFQAIPALLGELSQNMRLQSSSRVEVLTTGDELIEGTWKDLHSQTIAHSVSDFGGMIYRFNTVGDHLGELVTALNEITQRAAVCVVTGGLGPTIDDLTVDALSSAAAVDAPIIEECWKEIITRFPQLKSAESSNRRQARLPEGAIHLSNHRGTAPGIYMQIHGCHVFAFPGPPNELSWFIEYYLAPWFRYLLREAQSTQYQKVLRVALVGESQISQQIQATLLPEDVSVGYQAMGTEHRIKVKASASQSLDEACRIIKSVAGEHYLNDVDRSLAEEVIECAKTLGLTIGFAESCTGGQLSAEITAIPGSSSVFWGGIISYSNEIKERALGVPLALLMEHGAVSESCAEAMAMGARKSLEVDWAVSVTGIAGPGGGTESKPVGTVCFAWSSANKTLVKRKLFRGERSRIQSRSVSYALFTLLKLMKGEGDLDESI